MESEAKAADHRGLIGGLIGLIAGLVIVEFSWKAVIVLGLAALGWAIAQLWPD